MSFTPKKFANLKAVLLRVRNSPGWAALPAEERAAIMNAIALEFMKEVRNQNDGDSPI